MEYEVKESEVHFLEVIKCMVSLQLMEIVHFITHHVELIMVDVLQIEFA